MYVRITISKYTQIKNLSFSPEIDLTGNSIPVNQFSCDILTNDEIRVGTWAYLYDDLNNLWAKYWLIDVQVAEGIRHITAQSIVSRLDRKRMDLNLYQGETVAASVSAVMASLPSGTWELDSALANATLSGYAPEQTARERLLWICFVIGAYVADFFADKIQIIPIGARQSIIPYENTYWRPVLTNSEYVTKISVRAYTYTAGQPDVTDDWISDGSTDYYIETHQDISLVNPNVPAGMPDNELDYTDISLINDTNATRVLNRLALYYFNRARVELPAINNGMHHPGHRCYGYLDKDKMINGYVESVDFSFGTQAKGVLSLIGVGGDINIESARITVVYKFGNFTIDKKVYTFPVGYDYEITCPWYDTNLNGHRYVFRPTHKTLTGRVSGATTITEQLNVALDYYTQELLIVSVDDSTNVDGIVEIS